MLPQAASVSPGSQYVHLRNRKRYVLCSAKYRDQDRAQEAGGSSLPAPARGSGALGKTPPLSFIFPVVLTPLASQRPRVVCLETVGAPNSVLVASLMSIVNKGGCFFSYHGTALAGRLGRVRIIQVRTQLLER